MESIENLKHIKRIERHEQKRNALKKKRKKSQIGCLLLIIGFACTVYSLRMFNFSIFQFKYYILLTILLGVISNWIVTFLEQEIFDTKEINFVEVWLYGSIMLSLTFLTNKYASFSENYQLTLPIISRYTKYSEAGRGTHNVDVVINGIEQEILLPRNKRHEVENADSIIITLNKGLFGINSIVETKLK